MRKVIYLVAFLGMIQTSNAQHASADLMAGHNYLHYQHNIVKLFKARLSWQHIATLIKHYKNEENKTGLKDELMNQVYVVFKASKLISLKGGLFYTNTGGYKPSLAIQFAHQYKNGFITLVPRMDIHKNPSYEVFFLADQYATLSAKTRLAFRLQAMSNFGKQYHNRSYQIFRIGFERNNYQVGPGITLDQYGTNNKVFYNTGIFIKKSW
jgi:hypothetical protein